MPIYVIEREFAEGLGNMEELSPAINRINADIGVQWLLSFLSADKKKTYCLYEAPNPQLIQQAAVKVGLPINAIVEVSELQRSGLVADVSLDRFK